MTLPANVVMMPRHGASPHDVMASPYFIATSMQSSRISPQENVNKTKKSWGERLKIGGNKTKDDERRAIQIHEQQLQQHQHQHQQQQQQRELAANNYLLNEYRNKYGTLSGGSALSKSMKYAETWLYNSSVRQPNTAPSRPNILVYQKPSIAVIPAEVSRHNFQPSLIPHISMCSCPEFIGGTVRSKKNTTPTGICKKCGGSRMPWRGGGTLRASSVRVAPDNRIGGTLRVGQTRVRPSLMNVSSNFESFSPDPYDLMRRNRLGASTVEDETAEVKRGRRTKSTSPGRHQIRRSPSPPVMKQHEPRRARRDLCWEDVDDDDNTKRKSILECDVNPYQLIAKYLKNGERVEGNDGFASDNDDELSDDMSDNILEEKKQVIVDVKTKKNPEEKSSQKGVSIGGQRIRVFSNSTANDGEYVNDDDVPVKNPSPVSMIPRLTSPMRPQRRVKSTDVITKPQVVVVDDVNTDENESASSRDVETCSTNSQIERRSNFVSSHIKSILKKPSMPGAMLPTTVSSATPEKTFNDTNREPDYGTTLQSSTVPGSTTNSSSNFYLPTFQEFKRENRKKKQVQFNVQHETELANDESTTPEVLDGTTSQDELSDKVICDRHSKVEDNVIEVTFKVSEPKLRYFGDQLDDVLVCGSKDNKDNTGSETRMPPTVGHVWRDRHLGTDMDPTITRTLPPTIVTLRRSLSDRQIVPGEDDHGPTKQEQTAAMFNDTMRLRLLSGRRTDSRQAFSHPGASSNIDGVTKTKQRVLSPGRTRPKEPPPPPPLPTTVHFPVVEPEALVPDIRIPEIESEIIIPEDEPEITLPQPKFLKLIVSPPLETIIEPVSRPETELTTFKELKKKSEIPISVYEGAPPPPQLPPRHIFPFTKKQIQNINNTKRQTTKATPSSSLLRANTRKSRPNSCIPNIPTPTTDNGLVHHASRIRHRNSDPGPAMTKVSLPLPETPDVNEGVRTVVSVCPDSPDVHRLQIKTDVNRSRRTSILINGDDHDVNPHLKTSLMIDEKVDNNNKVTISVGGTSNGTWSVSNSCVIDTGSNSNSLTRVNHSTNQITIPVTPEPVYNQRSNIQVDDQHVMIVDRTTGKSLGTQHDYEVLEMLMDPVEAVRRHMVPHVCGRSNPDGGVNLVSPLAMDRLNTLFAEQRNGGYATSYTTGSVVEISSPESSLSDTNRYSSVICSEKNSSDNNSDQENNGISIHYFTAPCIPHFVLGDDHNEDDKLELMQAHKDIYDDAENIYESIKDPIISFTDSDPIYEEIGLPDIPPPLPLSPPPSLDDLDDKRTSRSIFEGASKYDILNYLVDAKERGYVESDYNSSNGDDIVEVIDGKPVELSSLGDLSSRVSNLSNVSDSSEDSNIITSSLDTKDGIVRKSSTDIERNDSGVGSETSKSSRSRWQTIPAGTIREDQIHLCEDCDQHVDTQVSDSGVMYAPLVCRKCSKKRAERKDTIAEIVETEEKYGGDLRIILEEFYRPMLVAGLLTSEQLSAIFLNVEELLENNAVLAEKLRDAHDIALEQGDEDLLTVNIGSLFLEAAPMLHAFESYCTRQGGASLLLANLEKEKELLRIFLRVSQMENAVLRRMNLNSFLMVPVQRVTKYPLLLARLHKVTPAHHEGRELLKQAQHKIELHLEHMNSVAKDISTTKLWRRISIVNGRRSSSEIDMINIKLRKMSVDVLEWNHDEVKFAMEGRMLYTNPTDNNWRKGRTIKLNPINALLVTNGKQTEDYRPEDELLLFPRKTGVKEATLLLVKEKCGRYSLLRDPLYLDKCIVCCETDWEDYFEVQELASKDTFIFKAEDSERTKLWYRQLQYHSQGLGAWRRRRNALANIMINGMSRN